MQIQKLMNFSLFHRNPRLHILDGGDHGSAMNNFASIILKDTGVKIKSHEVETHPKYEGVKMIKSLKENADKLYKKVKPGDYVAIPASASSFIINLDAGVREILHIAENFTQENVGSKRNILLAFLRRIADDKTVPDYIDMDKQGFEHLYGLIQSINKFVDKGVNVYIPAGHPSEHVIKYKFEQTGEKPYLYRYVATGKDPEGKVKKFLEELKEQKIQKLNLLGLSKAHMVTIEDLNKNNYIYGAYDSFVTDRARGVHNFSPVRDKNGKLLGYSYHDTSTPEILYDDYNDNDEIENIVKFTGLNIRECLADEKAHQDFKKGKINSDKIYSMKKILSQNEIEAGKLDYLGEYISADKKLVFDTNSRDEVLFQKTNCEGSERPSVVSMWGSCFATLNKIKEDIYKTLGYNNK